MRQLVTLLSAFLMLLTLPLFSQDLFLRDNLSQAQVGDYIITTQNRMYTALVIAAKDSNSVQIQEISIPEGLASAEMGSWRHWLQQGAPGNTGWIAYEVGLQDGRLLDCFSYTRNAWCEIPSADSFLSTILNLRLSPMETKFRRRTGGGDNSRGYWQPKLIVNGQAMANAAFEAYKTRWPNDGSELANKQIEMYLPAYQGPYPNYFPYWLQVNGAVGKARVRIIDSGKDLRSPAPAMPIRPLAFTNNGRIENGNLHLWLKTRPHHGELALFAVDAKNAARPIALNFSLKTTNQTDILLLEVPQKELEEKLIPGMSYRFVIHPWRHPDAAAETTDAIRYT